MPKTMASHLNYQFTAFLSQNTSSSDTVFQLYVNLVYPLFPHSISL